MTRKEKFIEILQAREIELMSFIELPHIRKSEDFWFFKKTLEENRIFQILLKKTPRGQFIN